MHNFCEKQDIWNEAHEQGIEQGMEKGIRTSVKLERRHGVDDATIIRDLTEEYYIDEKTAEKYVAEKTIN